MARLLDPKKNGAFPFEYRSSAATDVRKTFERIREQQRKDLEWRVKNAIELKRKAK